MNEQSQNKTGFVDTDFQTLEGNTVTGRNRDTTKQDRVKTDEILW